MADDQKEYTPLKLDKGLKEVVKKKAEEENRSVNNYIETSLIEKTGYKKGIHTKKREY